MQEPRKTHPRPNIRGLLGTTFFFSVFTNLLMFTGPLFMLQVYDRVLASRSEETLVALFGLVAVLYAFYGLIEYARKHVILRVGVRLQEALNEPAFSAIIERRAGRAHAKAASLQDVDAVNTVFASPVILALFDIPWTPLFLAALFIFHPTLGWLGLSGGLLLIAAALLNQLMTAQKTKKSVQHAQMASRFARQAEAYGEYVLAQGMRRTMLDRWSELKDRAIDQSVHANDWGGSFAAFTKAFRLFLQSAVLAMGAWLVLQGQLSAGAIIAATILLGRALAPIDTGIAQWQIVQRGYLGWRAIKELLAQPVTRDPATTLPVPKPHLHAKDVSLILAPGGDPVLHRVSFEIRPGQALGVIGRSGSGKTTLARVVTGTLTPSSGEVRLAGATLDQYGFDQLGAFIGYLPQDVHFFDGTVAENIARMATNPDPGKVVAAAKKARAHEVILNLPEGYDTQVSGSSFSLSGGQKQRLGLARALYDDPVLLVLDEPNAALDSEGAEALNQAIKATKLEGRSVLIMTHRQAALSACDALLVLENGRAVTFGPRDEVIRSMIKPASDSRRVAEGARR